MNYFQTAAQSMLVGSTGMKARPCQQEPAQYRQIVERHELVALANLGTLNEMVELCRIADVNQRPLSRALRIILNTTPRRHLHALRLAKARLQWRGSSRGSRSPVRCRPPRTVRQWRLPVEPASINPHCACPTCDLMPRLTRGRPYPLPGHMVIILADSGTLVSRIRRDAL